VRWKTFITLYGNYIQDYTYEILSESAWFCRRCDNTFGVFSGFAVPIAVHLQNVNVTFHKRHYSSKLQNL